MFPLLLLAAAAFILTRKQGDASASTDASTGYTQATDPGVSAGQKATQGASVSSLMPTTSSMMQVPVSTTYRESPETALNKKAYDAAQAAFKALLNEAEAKGVSYADTAVMSQEIAQFFAGNLDSEEFQKKAQAYSQIVSSKGYGAEVDRAKALRDVYGKAYQIANEYAETQQAIKFLT